ncbi:MAG TPA: glucose-6-phosphate dehydrogenase assembly protein OpcA [Acidimicrobiales bacterium]|nr:glucose-6-phosphate dehydrogenase assembly protein OpcA [Acidimicrobiales bacterium]
MADAVTELPAPERAVAGDPEAPHAVQTWEGRGVGLGEVIAALPELRRQASGRGAGTRTAVMTIVMVIKPDDDPEVVAAPIRALGAHHPCRALVLRPDLDSTPVIDAREFLWQAEPVASGGGHPVFFEELYLHVGGQAASHLSSIVGPFVLADLPVVMWFPDALPDPADPLLRLASALVVDTRVAVDDRGAIAHSYRTLLELANHQPVVDLSWVRLQPWRELLAGLFEPEHIRPFLQCVRSVSVSGKPGPRHILAGWLMAELDLRARELAMSDSKHVEINLEAVCGSEEGVFQVRRDDGTRAVWAKASLSNGMSHSQALPLPDDSLTSALSAAISNLRADRVWERALAAAAALAS